jgi:short-subunit dehydrogenase
MTDLEARYGPWALVAGASEGIGAAFARLLADAGLDLVLVARRQAPLEALAGELRASSGRTIVALPLDLASSELPRRFTELAAEYQIGLVVYNAASSVVAPFLETSLDDHQRMLDVNARGPLAAAHVFGKAMVARRRGGIVLLSSLTAFWGSPWVATYGATKAFNLSLGEALAHEFSESGVDVVVSCAGATSTPGFLKAVEGRKAPASMTPEAVARETLDALRTRRAFVPGAGNRSAAWLLTHLVPRTLAVRIMAANTKRLL